MIQTGYDKLNKLVVAIAILIFLDTFTTASAVDGDAHAKWGQGAHAQGSQPEANDNTSEGHHPILPKGDSRSAHIRVSLSLQSGTPYGWGNNEWGMLGNGTNANISLTSVQVDGLTRANAIAGGNEHSLILQDDGTVWASGRNDYGPLGNGTYDWSDMPVQASFPLGTVITSIAAGAGAYHSLAVDDSGIPWAWGMNDQGQLGNGTTNTSNIPVRVSAIANVIATAAGGYHSLALRGDGSVWAWGSNGSGELGDGTNNSSPVPVKVFGLSNIIAVAAGNCHSLALKADGTVWAWGSDANGQLGNGNTIGSNIPVRVSGITSAIAIAAGYSHSLALNGDGTVWTWGYNEEGQLGNGTKTDSYVPLEVSTLADAVAIAAGVYHSLVLKADGTAWACGANSRGQLGNGTIVDSYVPARVSNLAKIIAIAGGGMHSLALTTCPAMDLNPNSLQNGLVNEPYYQVIAASGGIEPYSYEITLGNLPSGLTLSSEGVFSGTPAALGSAIFTVMARDAEGCPGFGRYSLAVCSAIAITPSSLPNGTVGQAYNQTISATGGTAPLNLTITAGSLPPGLSLNAAGALWGLPTMSGAFSFTVTATDGNGCSGSGECSLTVAPMVCPTISLNPTILPDGTVGTGYSQTITASGGYNPYNFAVTAGTMPARLNLSSAGVLSGTPILAGTFEFMVSATDAAGCRGSKTYTVHIVAGVPGDCDGNGTVPIGEVQKAINMFLGTQSPTCGVDCDGNGQVSIGEVQKVINAFLGFAASC